MTKPRFYHRFERKNNFFDDFQKSFAQSGDVYLFTCFFDIGGFRVVEAHVKRKKALNLKLLVDLDCSKSDALRKACVLMKKNSSHFQVRYYGGNELFHSKLAFFKNAAQNVVFMGSSNLTGYGFHKHIETNIKLTGKLIEFERFCKDRWDNAVELKLEDIQNSPEKNKQPEPVKTKKRRHPKEIPPRWEYPLHHRPKPPIDQEKFMKQLWAQLPRSFKKSFHRPVFKNGWAYISERSRKNWGELNYSFWFNDYVSVVIHVALSKHPQSKKYPLGLVSKFCDYLTQEQKKFRTLRHNLGLPTNNIYLRHYYWRGANRKRKEKCPFSCKKMKSIHSKNNKKSHTATLYIQKDLAWNISKVKNQMKKLEPIYNFIKEGIDG